MPPGITERGREYPAPGFRNIGNGALFRAGYGGFSYSSSVTNSNARYLDFSDNWIYLQHNNGRAFGFQVRCLQE